jgi:hypothetical protein
MSNFPRITDTEEVYRADWFSLDCKKVQFAARAEEMSFYSMMSTITALRK